MKKVGLYGGSFNPIHIGHLTLANYLCEYKNFDEIWFLVTPINPWKEEKDLWPDSLRLELVQLSIEGYSRFRASDFEFQLPRPSYTFHTLEALKERYPDIQFSLILGSDNWNRFDEWKEGKRIIAENEIYVYPRPGYPVDKDKIPSSVHLVHTPLLNISSSFIRKAIEEGRDVRFFVRPPVWSRLTEYLLEIKNRLNTQ
jgi:nicotinate-nucleotide adenylyltransferase